MLMGATILASVGYTEVQAKLKQNSQHIVCYKTGYIEHYYMFPK